MLRAVGVGRVSTRRSSQETSIDRQQRAFRTLARSRGWKVAGWFEDTESGKTLNRPGLRGALDLLFANGADIIVVDDLDRLGRNTREMLETVDALKLAGKGFYVRDSEIDATGSQGRLIFTMMTAFAEYFRRALGEKVVRGLEAARKQGRIGGRPRSIDYSKKPRARALRRAGKSWTQIAGELGGGRGAWQKALGRK